MVPKNQWGYSSVQFTLVRFFQFGWTWVGCPSICDDISSLSLFSLIFDIFSSNLIVFVVSSCVARDSQTETKLSRSKYLLNSGRLDHADGLARVRPLFNCILGSGDIGHAHFVNNIWLSLTKLIFSLTLRK